jgi:phosphoribosylformimino-5-aminoimidazole carboxamide ribotide isomerase
MKDVERAAESGVTRIILGTAAVNNPELVSESIQRFGAARVAVGLDAKKGQVKIRGWKSNTTHTALDLARQMAQMGLRTAIHTDIDRDGVLTGVNAPASAELARNSGLKVIASGGVASLEDVRAVKARMADGLSGVISGRALYDGRLDLSQAIAIAKERF